LGTIFRIWRAGEAQPCPNEVVYILHRKAGGEVKKLEVFKVVKVNEIPWIPFWRVKEIRFEADTPQSQKEPKRGYLAPLCAA
jgi:hypothetical protein